MINVKKIQVKKLSLGILPLIIGFGAYKYIHSQEVSQASHTQSHTQAQTMNQPIEITTPSGLRYVITKAAPTDAPQPQAGKLVTVHYSGYLEENGKAGTKFDSSVDRGMPFKFTIGVQQVIAGWDEGVMGMRVGEKRRLIIPAKLGYGARGIPGVIPGNATLIFDVELLKVG